MWTIPNVLTYLRIVFIPIIFYMLMQYKNDPSIATTYAFFVFVFMSITDYLDGFLARKLKQQSDIGRFLDPIADKLLITSCLIAMIQTKFLGWIDILPSIVIILRDIFVSGLRDYIAGYGAKIHVSKLAKYKTTLQMLSVAILIWGFPFGKLSYTAINIYEHIYTLGQSLLILAAFISVITALDYCKVAFSLMRNEKQ